MKYLSFFSGIGGFELGIRKALKGKATCVGYSEIDPHAIKTYAKHFPRHRNLGDITKIDPKKLPRSDLIVGGFPCQAFSLAGKRKGFEDKRGAVFFTLAEIIRHARPKYLLLENVHGLLCHENGTTYLTIKNTLGKLGYVTQRATLNSKDYVPQHRQRIFIAGYRRDVGTPEILPFSRAAPHPRRAHSPQTRSGIVNLIRSGFSSNRIVKTEGICPALLASDIPLIQITNTSNREFGWKSSPAPALVAGDSKNPKLIRIGPHIRKLTPKECCRLQGFPDDWLDGMSDSAAYKAIGNAVTVPAVAAAIAMLFNKAKLPQG